MAAFIAAQRADHGVPYAASCRALDVPGSWSCKWRREDVSPRRARRERRWRAPDLVKRDFPAAGINVKWYGDGTDIDTDEGKLYLDSVLDVGSRRVLGFALGEYHDADLAYGALAMAVAVRGGHVPGVIFHTDQGSTPRACSGPPAPGCRLPVDGPARVGSG